MHAHDTGRAAEAIDDISIELGATRFPAARCAILYSGLRFRYTLSFEESMRASCKPAADARRRCAARRRASTRASDADARELSPCHLSRRAYADASFAQYASLLLLLFPEIYMLLSKFSFRSPLILLREPRCPAPRRAEYAQRYALMITPRASFYTGEEENIYFCRYAAALMRRHPMFSFSFTLSVAHAAFRRCPALPSVIMTRPPPAGFVI